MSKRKYTVVLDSRGDADVIAELDDASNRSAWLADACRRKVRELPALERVLAHLETMGGVMPRSARGIEPPHDGLDDTLGGLAGL
jgi:hypothetical protein